MLDLFKDKKETNRKERPPYHLYYKYNDDSVFKVNQYIQQPFNGDLKGTFYSYNFLNGSGPDDYLRGIFRKDIGVFDAYYPISEDEFYKFVRKINKDVDDFLKTVNKNDVFYRIHKNTYSIYIENLELISISEDSRKYTIKVKKYTHGEEENTETTTISLFDLMVKYKKGSGIDILDTIKYP